MNKKSPPKIASWMLKRLMPGYIGFSALGDYDEVFFRIIETDGWNKARRWYWTQVLKAIPRSLFWGGIMFQSYLKTAMRNLRKHKLYSAINLIGLALGMACAFLILLWIQDELSYDHFHEHANQIYRVILTKEEAGKTYRFIKSPVPLAPALVNDYPQILHAVTLHKNAFRVAYKQKLFQETIFFADPSIFEIFSFPLKSGDPQMALAEPYSMVISEDMSQKYFEEENPIGKVLMLNDGTEYKITGVIRNIPNNSHMSFDFLSSFQRHRDYYADQWGISNFYTYILTTESFSPESFHDSMADFVEQYRGKESSQIYKIRYQLQPLTSIHLHSHLANELKPNGDILHLYIFGGVGLFILLIACFNYINLCTAQYTTRTLEVGIRKVMGANRGILIKQFFGESLVLSMIALVIAVLFSLLVLPVFNSFAGKTLHFDFVKDPWLLLSLVVTAFFTGTLAGSYPAFFLSAFQANQVLRGTEHRQLRGIVVRKALVIIQFAISIIFVVGTLVIFEQLQFMRQKKLGFNKDFVLNIPIQSDQAAQKMDTIKREFLQSPSILNVSASNFSPGKVTYNQNYWYEGAEENSYQMIRWLAVDYDFIATYDIELVEGRNFSPQFPTDVEQAYILNQSAIQKIGWESPVGKQFEVDKRGSVIGVVKDFHFFSLHQSIEPVALCVYPSLYEYISVRIRPENILATIDHMQSKWQRLIPGQPFSFSFLDEDYDTLYHAEKKLATIFSYISLTAIVIACLGLFGLAALTAELRTKEIGIRKILGASAFGLVAMLSREYLILVFIANLVAWPVAWLVMHRWLQSFAYHISLEVWIFFLAGMGGLIIAWLAVSYQALRSAYADPVKSLRYE